jgi:hypothetical protein
LLVATAALLVLFLVLRRTRFGLVALFAAVLVSGIFGYRQATAISSPIDITRLLELRDQNVELQGVIVTDTGHHATPAGETDSDRLRFALDLKAVRRVGEWQPGRA